MLRIPDNRDEQIQGFAGETGWRFSFGGKPERAKEVFDMPRGDGTGPTGAGPRSGGMKGLCMGIGDQGNLDRSQGIASMGGGGKSRRNRFIGSGPGEPSSNSGFVPGDQLEALKAQAEHMEEALDGIKRRIQELETQRKQ